MDKQWTDILWRLANGDAVQYKEFKAMDIFEFFQVIESNKKMK